MSILIFCTLVLCTVYIVLLYSFAKGLYYLNLPLNTHLNMTIYELQTKYIHMQNRLTTFSLICELDTDMLMEISSEKKKKGLTTGACCICK